MRSPHRVHHGAITLTEVVVFVGIVVFLLVLLLPAINKLGPCGGNREYCANNLKQIGLALHNYADMHPHRLAWGLSNPRLPAGTIPNAGLETDQRFSWVVELLPFLEEDVLYRQVDQSAAWDEESNLPVSHTSLRIFQCPAWKREFRSANSWETPYVGIAGVRSDAATRSLGDPKIGAFGYDRRTAFVDAKDGTSNTSAGGGWYVRRAIPTVAPIVFGFRGGRSIAHGFSCASFFAQRGATRRPDIRTRGGK